MPKDLLLLPLFGGDFFVQGCAYCGGFVWSGVVGVVSLRCCRFDGELSSNE